MLFNLRKARWDEWAIRAELRRRGFSFKGMALESGMSASSMRMALKKPLASVNRIIATILDVPLHELWPDWFDADGELIPAKIRAKLSRQRAGSASHESRVA